MPFSSLACLSALSRRFRIIAAVGGLAFASASHAQWPTDYTQPKILGGGANVRAAAIKLDAANDVYVAYDDINVANRNIIVEKYGVTGEQLLPIVDTTENVPFSERIRLLNAPGNNVLRGIVQSAMITPSSIDPSFLDFRVDFDGEWVSSSGAAGWIPMDAINIADTKYATFVENFMSRRITMINNSGGINAFLDLADGAHIGDAELVSFGGETALACYTKIGLQPGTPGEVWTMAWTGEGSLNQFSSPYQIHPLAGADQSNMHLTKLDSSSAMVTWLEEYEGHKSLYAAVRDTLGDEISTPRNCFTDVVDYVVTTSTLGIPVFAAVTRTSDMPLQESLVGGLLNPANGGTVTIPISDVPGVKVKELRQEANGDFSLLYSVPENGTNLLKVRRISGVSASTLWETIVADLGRASDDIIENYPNTWVVGTANNVLYILARYDEPGTVNSSFQLVRLRADGTMGSN